MGMRLISVTVPEAYLDALEELVRRGVYPNRSAAIRAAIRDLLVRHGFLKDEEGVKKFQ